MVSKAPPRKTGLVSSASTNACSAVSSKVPSAAWYVDEAAGGLVGQPLLDVALLRAGAAASADGVSRPAPAIAR